MKICIAVISLTLLVHASMAKPTRSKRSDPFVDLLEANKKLNAKLMPLTENSIKNALEKLPKTENYAVHRRRLQAFLTEVQTKINTPETCLDKYFEIIKTFQSILTVDEDAPEEAKKVVELLNSDDDDDMDNEVAAVNNIMARSKIVYANKKFDSRRLNADDTERFNTLTTEMC